jgi:ribosomal protein L11 methyltransferase
LKWIEIKVVTTPIGEESVSAIMLDIGTGGLYIEDPRDITEKKGKPTDWDYLGEEFNELDPNKVTIRTYLSENDNYVEKISLLREKLKALESELDIGSGEIELNDIFEQDWANNWKKYYKPIKIGERTLIKPTWEEYKRNGDMSEIIVELDPGMAFGTGTHETTMMCAQFLETYVCSGMKILDIGCGSGILGIIALKLGAKNCFSVDIEANAVKVTQENAKLNNVYDKMEIVRGDLLEVVNGSFDIITANIIADAIVLLACIVAPYLNENGIFIASGIIADRHSEVKESLLKHGFIIKEEKFMGEWTAIAVSR